MRAAELGQELNAAAAKLSPPALVASAAAAGWGPQEWMYTLTAAYVVLQAIYLLWKWRREAKGRRRGF